MIPGILVYTGKSQSGREVAVNYHGTAQRGVVLVDTCGPIDRPFTGGRPRGMKLDARMYSRLPREWPR